MKRSLSTTQKLVASAAVIATAGALTAGAFAGWLSTDSQHQDVSAATISSTFTAQDAGAWDDVDLMNVLPGDSITRLGTLTNTGSISQTFTLAVDGAEAGNLTAAEDGVTVEVKACPQPWGEGQCTEPANVTTLFATDYVTDDGVLSDEIVLAAGAHTYLQVVFALPTGAAQIFQGLSDKFVVTETGVATSHVGSTVILTDANS